MSQSIDHQSTPTVLVVFGATGDLMGRKIVPALYHLFTKHELPRLLQIIGVARRDLSEADFHNHLRMILTNQGLADDESFLKLFQYQQGTFDDSRAYRALAERLGQTDTTWQACSNKLFHLAVPPTHVETILQQLSNSHLTEPCSDETGWTRILVEKPFGRDLASSEQLDRVLSRLFREEQIYRIDHYLGKDMLQHVMNFRFANHLFEPSWHAEHVARIDIHFLETLSVGDRGAFFDGVGALRDVGQNHMLQMLALTTMEAPPTLSADAIRTARAQLFRAIRTPETAMIANTTVRGQYQTYRTTEGVDPASSTETYFRLKLTIDNARWRDVPIYLEAGKAMESVQKDIVVTMKHPDPCVCPPGEHYRNTITFQVEPLPLIAVRFWAKKPGFTPHLVARDLTFTLDEKDRHPQAVEGYAQLLADAIRGDQTSFVSTSELKEMWRVIDPIITGWHEDRVPLITYEDHTPTIRAITQIAPREQEEK